MRALGVKVSGLPSKPLGLQGELNATAALRLQPLGFRTHTFRASLGLGFMVGICGLGFGV